MYRITSQFIRLIMLITHWMTI